MENMETEVCPHLRPFDVKGVLDQKSSYKLMAWMEPSESDWSASDLRVELDNLKVTVSFLAEKIDTMHEARDLPKDLVKTLVKGYTMDIPEDEPIYPSDIAYRYCLDPDMVEEVMEELLEEGFFK